jgi:hypothetical protein
MTIESITIAPFLIFAEEPNSFRQTHAYQPDGPDSITKGYAILKNRGDDERPEELMAGEDVRLLLIAAKALAADFNVPLHRPAWLKKLLPEVVSIQIMPYYDICMVGEPDQVYLQEKGPDNETNGWAVYLRQDSGEAMWVADASNQKDAEFIGQGYAKHLGVEIEPYPWLAKGE